jgi:mannose-1-phosphate guanylyltransferase
MRYGVIMAGGAGTRLWPLSRNNMPKQMLAIVRGKSLLQLSYERLRGLLPPEQIVVCVSSAHAALVRSILPELPPENLLGEPEPRDTACAVGYTAAVLRKKDPNAVAAVMTADHVIQPADKFQAAVRTAFEVAESRPASLVAFGITPTHGHTGLGYLQRGEALSTPGAYRVQAFKEKPDKPTADRYVESGRFYWNSGMFVWRCDTVLAELASHLPEASKGIAQIAEAWGTAKQDAVLADVYPKLPKISIDYAVMEPASHGRGKSTVVVVEMPVQWIDVGSWPALAETLELDEHNNAISAGSFCFVDSDDNVVVTDDPEHLISTIGISDMVIVHTRDATLICPKEESQRVKDLVGRLKDKFQGKYS